MTEDSKQVWLAGVDGCPGGWIAAFVQTSGEQGERRVFSKFAEILDAPEKPSITAVDVPIGLPECGGRTAENSVRPLLGKLKRSVFPIPSRRAIFAELGPFKNQRARYAAHQRTCAIAAATSNPPKRITIQAFALFPKIREVDAVLRSRPSLKSHVYETHPELAFWKLNGERPLDQPKNAAIGIALRQQLLVASGIPASIVKSEPPKGAAVADLLDALACAFVARRIAAGLARSFPHPTERDQFDLPMAIWA